MVHQAKHALGDDVVLDLGRARKDRHCLVGQERARGVEFVLLELVALPAKPLLAEDFDQQFLALLLDAGAQDESGAGGAECDSDDEPELCHVRRTSEKAGPSSVYGGVDGMADS